MSKDVERTESETENLPANPEQKGFFGQYGEQAAQHNFTGKILKFAKGRYAAGQDNEEVETGTRVIVDMPTLIVGWQKWWGGRPVDAYMGPVVEGYQPPAQKSLDDRDKTDWEADKDGVKRDPWQFTNMVVMRQIGTAGENEGLFTFSTSSRGGLNAIGVLCKKYDQKTRMDDPELLPIIELNASTYRHSDKQRGIIDIPVFEVVGWGKAADVEDATGTVVEGATGEAEENGEEEVQAKARTAPKTTPRAGQARAEQAAATRKPAPTKKAAPGKKKVRF